MNIEVVRREEAVGHLSSGRMWYRRLVRWVIVKDGKDLLKYPTRKEASRVAQGMIDKQPRTDGRCQIIAVRYPRHTNLETR